MGLNRRHAETMMHDTYCCPTHSEMAVRPLLLALYHESPRVVATDAIDAKCYPLMVTIMRRSPAGPSVFPTASTFNSDTQLIPTTASRSPLTYTRESENKMSKFAPHRHSANNPRATSSTICQKCLSTGTSFAMLASFPPLIVQTAQT
jgi:hypothetical protein